MCVCLYACERGLCALISTENKCTCVSGEGCFVCVGSVCFVCCGACVLCVLCVLCALCVFVVVVVCVCVRA